MEEESWLLCFNYKLLFPVSVLCLFLTVPCDGLLCVIVAFPGHTLFEPLLLDNAIGMKNLMYWLIITVA